MVENLEFVTHWIKLAQNSQISDFLVLMLRKFQVPLQ
jgi:hypothetical protein